MILNITGFQKEISLSVDKGKLWGEMEVPIEIDLASRKDGERKSPGYRV